MASNGIASEVTVACEMIKAVKDGAEIINLSLGCQTLDDAPPVAIQAALDVIGDLEQDQGREVIIVAAAGNFGDARPCWPAAFRRVVSVAALAADLLPADVVQPRPLGHVLDAGRTTCTRPSSRDEESEPEDRVATEFGPNPFAVWSGTSFAAPQVSGAIARLHQVGGFPLREALATLLAAAGRCPGPARPGKYCRGYEVRNCLAAYHRRSAGLCLYRRQRRNIHVPDAPFRRRMVRMADESEVSRLVQASEHGDEAAWNELVRRFAPLVMAVTRNYQLTAEDAQDVSQTVWLRLVEHLGSLREPEALPGWLATTTQRECVRLVQRGRRVQPVDPHTDGVLDRGTTVDPDDAIIRAELRQALRDGLAELPKRDQLLLQLRAADPPMSYEEIAELTDMRIGSIGPTLRRCLDRLRATTADAGLPGRAFRRWGERG